MDILDRARLASTRVQRIGTAAATGAVHSAEQHLPCGFLQQFELLRFGKEAMVVAADKVLDALDLPVVLALGVVQL